MPDTPLDPETELALKSLADIVAPEPVSLLPQTWGWVLVAILLLALIVVAYWHWLRRRRANRYRREALELLDQLESDGDEATISAEVPKIVKRVALAAWDRNEVASRSGSEWVAFLQNSLPDQSLGAELAHVLDDQEYRSALPNNASPNTGRLIAAARHWIKTHHVPA
ncbi:DUF4381 domain-containing protein [Phyllobacterium lublinensis]|uniref:DUF4381 domain-containing protein n=1 Tax=Phyllobacterium lublinensis TaxID=2875708 RepID=UPI001CCE61D3|nr:DUF4381 domain-containing protein [Phyllobacterium sp. 2063]MBZ9656353.1 DUF4381 domain-containing protein [Phyllobacterium sp. 2063]